MSRWKDDPFELVTLEQEGTEFSVLQHRDAMLSVVPVALPSVSTARLHGFDLGERPLLVGLPGVPYEIVAARATLPLLRAHVGSNLVVLFDEGDVRRPIVIGVLEEPRAGLPGAAVPAPLLTAQVDDQKIVLKAEREIVLECGDASITLTRAGKVVIKGTYVVSRSSGSNKIRGAAVEIN